MNEFESVKKYLLSGSESDEGLTAQEEFNALVEYLKQVGLYTVPNFNVYDNLLFTRREEAIPFHPLFPPTASSFTDARANQTA